MVGRLPCDIHDCEHHKFGYCQEVYPTMEPMKIGKKMHVICADYKSKQEEE